MADDKAVKHWTIAAELGSNSALEMVKSCYMKGLVSKDIFAVTLRAHQAKVDARKSPMREAAERHRKQEEQNISSWQPTLNTMVQYKNFRNMSKEE